MNAPVRLRYPSILLTTASCSSETETATTVNSAPGLWIADAVAGASFADRVRGANERHGPDTRSKRVLTSNKFQNAYFSAAFACRSSSASASPEPSSSRQRSNQVWLAARSLSLSWQSPAKSAAFLFGRSL